MRTRKRIRDKIEKSKPAEETIIDPEDFIDEDYKAVWKLLKEHAKAHKNPNKRQCLPEENLSTESDLELRERLTPAKSKSNNTFSDSPLSESDRPESRQRAQARTARPSDKNKPKSASDCKDLRSGPTERKLPGELPSNKRNVKALQKAKEHLNEFVSLVMDLNNSRLTQATIEECSEARQAQEAKRPDEKDGVPTGRCISLVKEDETPEQSRHGAAGAVQKLAEEKEPWPRHYTTNEKLTLDPRFQTTQQVELQRPAAGIVNGGDIPTVVPIPGSMVTNQRHLTTMSGYPLRNNQWIHVKWAFHITLVKRQLLMQQQYLYLKQREAEYLQQMQQRAAKEEAVRIHETQD